MLEACCCKLKFMSNIWQCFKGNDSVHLDSLIEMFRGALFPFLSGSVMTLSAWDVST